jgi:hypothetical protein
MAANTIVDWTPTSSPNGYTIYTSTITVDTANVVAWTKKTPQEFDTSKPAILTVTLDTALDSQATPLALYYGYTKDAALSGTAAVTETNAAYGVQLLDDGGYATPTVTRAIQLDPNLAVANVVTLAAVATGLKVKTVPAPYFLFNFTAGSGTLLGAVITLKLIQK